MIRNPESFTGVRSFAESEIRCSELGRCIRHDDRTCPADQSSGYSPQVIVGVSRGGWPPARVMSDLLENPNLANMKVEFYRNIGVTAQRPKITQPVTSEVIGKRVLVVDDVADSGHSLRVASKHLRRRARGRLGSAPLPETKSIFKPNHYARTTSKWVIFPWERLEAINLIKRNLRSKGKTSNVIRELKGAD